MSVVRLKDIAARLNVSSALVCAALNDNYKSKNISGQRRQLIKQTAKEMGYKVDDMARAIRTGKSKVIGFISPKVIREDGAKIINGLSGRSERYDYTLKIIDSQNIVNDMKVAEKAVNKCIEKRLAAVIVHGLSNIDILNYLNDNLSKNGIQMALICNSKELKDVIHVKSNDKKGIEQAVDCLYKLGHREFLCVSLSLEKVSSENRQKEFLNAIRKRGINNAETVAEYIPNSTKMLDRIFASKKQNPTAIICTGDNIAVFTKDYLSHRYGLRTPEDVSITGFGDYELARQCYPSISTIYEPFKEMSERLIDKIIAKLQGRDFGEHTEYIDTSFILRDTCSEAMKN